MALFGLIGTKQTDGKRRLSPNTRSAIRIAHLPGIIPRIRALGGKFGHFAYLLALIYRSARLLPAGHPMLNPANIGRFGMRDVIATAANGLVMKRENIDQIFVFGAVFAALAMIFIQAILIAFYAFFSSANAQQTNSSNYFTTANPETDVMFGFLRNVFGVKNIFGDDGAIVVQTGLHAILGFYSTAMMIIAVIIVIYYVITIVGESAQTGTPFGKRFNGLWAPVRLILALGLLVPLGGGLNTAQYMTLMVAKFGSSLATNAWSTYTKTFTFKGKSCSDVAKAGDTDKNCGGIGLANTPSVEDLGRFIFTAEVCRGVYNKVNSNSKTPVNIYAEFNGTSSRLATFDSSEISAVKGRGSLRYVWSTDKNGKGISDPTCGSISMDVNNTTSNSDQYTKDLIKNYQDFYIKGMKDIVTAVSGGVNNAPATDKPVELFIRKYIITGSSFTAAKRDEVTPILIAGQVGAAIDTLQDNINSVTFTQEYSDNVVQKMREEALTKGWGTAGSYYLEMAKVTQAVLDAMRSTYPKPTQASIDTGNGAGDGSYLSFSAWWRWGKNALSGDNSNAAEKEIRNAMVHINQVQGVIEVTKGPKDFRGNVTTTQFTDAFASYNPLLVLARFMFGDALIRMLDKPSLNPMVQLIQAGSDILSKSETMAYAYAGAKAVEFVSSFFSGKIAGIISMVAAALGPIFLFIMLLGLVAGIILYYILPLMPFMYFFFSAVNWVIEVAEAFIAAPLFALSHLRIDGDGLPGQTAYAGWVTLFGVMLRPVLIVMGLIIGTLVFGAGSYYLALIYKQAIFSYRSAGNINVDDISSFGLIMYVLIFVYLNYMLANSAFKLIDTIPDKAMRWIGGQQPFTGDKPVDLGSMQTMAVAGYAGLTQAKDAVTGSVGGAQQRMKDIQEANALRDKKDAGSK